MDFDVAPFTLQSAAAGVLSWLSVVGILTFMAVLISFLLSVARNGAGGIGIFTKGLLSYLEDVGSLSPRRILALTNLTLKEAIRRKALLVFAVFAVLLMFAGWFLTNSNERAELQVGIHIAFILQTISWLLLPVVFFLSCWALPEDIRIRSLHTVVTKPARRIEIVLGRIFGMWIVTFIVLVSMGIIGYVWIVRQLPPEAKNQLTCRVPLFGYLHFLDREGQAAMNGMNVGDVWDFRSYIEGNSPGRGVFSFDGIDESSLVFGTQTAADGSGTVQVPGLMLECRFEAFRTVKGSESSIIQGVQAQYTLSNNPRETAFGLFAGSSLLRPVGSALRDAQYKTGANRLEEIAAKVATDSDSVKAGAEAAEVKQNDYFVLRLAAAYAADVLRTRNDAALTSAAAAFQKVSDSTNDLLNRMSEKSAEPYTALSAALTELAGVLTQDAETLNEHLPRLDVVLPSFHVAEYHEGSAQNINFVPRVVRFSADAETQSRSLAAVFEALNSKNQLVEGDALNPNLPGLLHSEGELSEANANLVTEVLSEQLTSGVLKVADGKLSVADGQRWLQYFDSLIQKNLLVSADSEGWMMERDLINDLTTDGRLRVEVSCVNDQMYLGMARPDLFIRKPDRAFLVGYTKALVSTALMLMLIVILGVTVSCIVKGPVALFFTLTFFIVGQFFHGFMQAILYSTELKGTGAIASAIMGAQHRGPSVGMDVSETTQRVVEGIDSIPRGLLWAFSQIVPDFTAFNAASGFVENGFDVPFAETVVPASMICLGFLIPCVLIAGALLKFRELESK
ncbi:MAG: hypothetical protein KDB01_21175 [Planctomycetaceae bacterium]|nr:hypothetical protein [Planctomycetaceae bacterium]